MSSLDMEIFVSDTGFKEGIAIVSLGRAGAFPSI